MLGRMMPRLWTVMTVASATLGCYVGCAWRERYRGNRTVVWARLVGGLVLVVLNLSAIIVVIHGYSFTVARITLRIALLADIFVAGALVGASAATIVTPWWNTRRARR
jgi:hypothetical protein